MKEKNFSIYNSKFKTKVDGGHLWKAPPRHDSGGVISLDNEEKKLSVYLHPEDSFAVVQEALFDLVKTRSFFYYTLLQIRKRLPSLLLLLPIALTVIFIGFFTVWGDLVINWFFLGKNANTIIGLPMNESALIYAIIAILIIYFFPVLFTREHEGFMEALNERFTNREAIRKRLGSLINFLKIHECIEKVEIWNPDLSNESYDWVARSLIPSFLDNHILLHLKVRIDERRLVENYFQKKSAKELDWEELETPQDEDSVVVPIAYEYLESWEKTLLAVYVFASTASLTPRWHQLQGNEASGVINNAVSLCLVKVLMERFAERLFSEEDLEKLISLDLFTSRCLNDYGILQPAMLYTNDVLAIDERVVAFEREEVDEEMKFMNSYLQTNIVEVIKRLDDPVAALKLNCTQENESIYNEKRLEAIRFFVESINGSEQYKILKKYWNLVIENLSEKKDMNNDVYRIIGVPSLLKLATIFERAAMYKHAYNALEYIERIYPFNGFIGKARIKERQGNFEDSVTAMLKIREDWKQEIIHLENTSVIDLNLDISWAIVSGRLSEYKLVGREAIADAESLLHSSFDTIRNSNQTIRMFNILANYEEWEGRPEAAITNYDLALQIPGVHQSGLSNLLVNKGIALRQINKLEEGSFYGEQGVEIKTAIGDADQLPIALHNLAQTYLELAFSKNSKEAKAHYFKKALKHAQKGLDIQSQTGSVKKRGQLLAEKFIGEYQLFITNQEGTANHCSESLKLVQEWLKNQSQSGNSGSHDCTVVYAELLSLIEPQAFKSIEEVINWPLPLKSNLNEEFKC
jgi:tetratricopeptide (TPR) repeat protein